MKRVTGLLAKIEAQGFDHQLAENAAERFADQVLAAFIAHSVPKFQHTFQPSESRADYRRSAYIELIRWLAPFIAEWRTAPTLVKLNMRGIEPTCQYEVPYYIAGMVNRRCFVSLSVTLPQGSSWKPSTAEAYPFANAKRSGVYWLDGHIPVPASAYTFAYADRSLYESLVAMYDRR